MTINALLKLGKSVVQNSGRIAKTGKPNIPRYLYHVTTEKNYESMLKSGKILTTDDGLCISELNGVFLFDLKNFLKRWTSTFFDFKEEGGKINLASALIGKNREAVVLRVPTKNFDINKLRIRVQNAKTDDYHALNGDSAVFQTLYTRRKKPIEYIYAQDININGVEKLGSTKFNLPEDFGGNPDALKFFQRKPFADLLELFKGQPEEKAVRAAQKANIKDKTIDFPRL